jgi:hypothetical protein
MPTIALPNRRSVLMGAALLVGAARANARDAATGPWAIELFTSQGCSSCPPADALLGTLCRRPDIVALSFHVDYWDYIGWKDPFASKATTERQRAYARVLKQRYIYTPEMVFEGVADDPGVERATVDEMLAAAEKRSLQRATPQLARATDGSLTVKLDAFPLDKGAAADVIVAAYDPRHTTPVARGENEGRKIENFNVVRRFETIARWDGSAASWTVPADRFSQGQGIAVLVQRADHGAMLGCNKLDPIVTG